MRSQTRILSLPHQKKKSQSWVWCTQTQRNRKLCFEWRWPTGGVYTRGHPKNVTLKTGILEDKKKKQKKPNKRTRTNPSVASPPCSLWCRARRRAGRTERPLFRRVGMKKNRNKNKENKTGEKEDTPRVYIIYNTHARCARRRRTPTCPALVSFITILFFFYSFIFYFLFFNDIKSRVGECRRKTENGLERAGANAWRGGGGGSGGDRARAGVRRSNAYVTDAFA